MKSLLVKLQIALGAAFIFLLLSTIIVCLLYTIGHFILWQPLVVPSYEMQLIALRAIALITSFFTVLYVLSTDFKFKVYEALNRPK